MYLKLSMKDNSIGKNIVTARKKANMTQKELAESMGIPYQSIGQWERGVRVPKFETIEKIARALNASQWDILGYAEEDLAEIQKNTNVLSEFSLRINNALEQLNDLGQLKAMERVEELTEIPKYQAAPKP